MVGTAAGQLSRLTERMQRLMAWLVARSWRRDLAILLVALMVFLPGQSSMPVTDRDEARFAQASRQMAETGDIVDIRFQDAPRHKKPVGIYWAQAASASIFGAEPIWPYRVPSWLAATLAALLLARIGKRLFSPGAGLVAGVAMASTMVVAFEAHIAKTDAMLLLCCTAALYGLVRIVQGAGGWGPPAVFWTALAAGMLVKGPIILMPVSGALVWLVIALRGEGALSRLKPLVGLGWLALLVLPWVVAISFVSDGNFWQASVAEDLLIKTVDSVERAGAPPGSYLMATWVTLWPWSLALIPALVGVWGRRRERRIQLLAVWLLPGWIAFEIFPTKLLHYTLPFYPALFLWIGAWIAGDLTRGRWRSWYGWLCIAIFGFVTLIIAAIAIGGPIFAGGFPAIWAVALIGLMLVVAVAAAWAAVKAERLAAVPLMAACTVLFSSAFFPGALPRLHNFLISERLVAALEATDCVGRPLSLVGYHEPSAVFLLGEDTRLDSTPASSAAWRSAVPTAVAFLPVDTLEDPGPLTEGVNLVSGTNYNGGKPVRLALVDAEGEVVTSCAP